MAVNSSRSMNADFHQGTVDRTFMQLTPNRGNVENVPIERYAWPLFKNVDKFGESPHLEAHIRHSVHPREIKSSGDGDTRAL
jgi:hypothetical protein